MIREFQTCLARVDRLRCLFLHRRIFLRRVILGPSEKVMDLVAPRTSRKAVVGVQYGKNVEQNQGIKGVGCFYSITNMKYEISDTLKKNLDS